MAGTVARSPHDRPRSRDLSRLAPPFTVLLLVSMGRYAGAAEIPGTHSSRRACVIHFLPLSPSPCLLLVLRAPCPRCTSVFWVAFLPVSSPPMHAHVPGCVPPQSDTFPSPRGALRNVRAECAARPAAGRYIMSFLQCRGVSRETHSEVVGRPKLPLAQQTADHVHDLVPRRIEARATPPCIRQASAVAPLHHCPTVIQPGRDIPGSSRSDDCPRPAPSPVRVYRSPHHLRD
ncbi:hypothetical protein QE412_002524 [Microbacterium trichothecenolyticum]|uniref:Secreted protein n=1 Tax=Microbacterium trichothecenolyticum TaxID=69370 RepID=A0ABU0TWB9_MICTR|nr:hypothetical protein [Microbacterium trichothecenolyticum]